MEPQLGSLELWVFAQLEDVVVAQLFRSGQEVLAGGVGLDGSRLQVTGQGLFVDVKVFVEGDDQDGVVLKGLTGDVHCDEGPVGFVTFQSGGGGVGIETQGQGGPGAGVTDTRLVFHFGGSFEI